MSRNFAAILAGSLLLHTAGAQEIEATAQRILDSEIPPQERETLITSLVGDSASLLRIMTRNLPENTPEEYRRIPWIWRVAIAAGKRNDADQIKEIIDISLPKENAPLRHWQAVVIGGGIINGLGLEGIWPGDRLPQILQNDTPLKSRWVRSLELASKMADDETVPTGTRYDALRMIALQPWDQSGEQLKKYLNKGVHNELQQGAISGLSDMKAAPIAEMLIHHIGNFSPSNRTLAFQALLRDEQRRKVLREAVDTGKIDTLPPEILARLRN